MKSIRLRTLSLCLLMQTALVISCSDSGSGSGKVQKFYSADEPGRWGAQAVDHDVQAVIIEDALGKRGIEVTVPLKTDERHYIEAIVLLDGDGRELAKKTFKRGEKAVALFEVTDKMTFPVYAVAKCNLHEMWRKKVEGSGKTRESRK